MPFGVREPLYSGREQSEEERVLWHMLENERYIGATTTASPERSIERELLSSPFEYTTSRHDGRPEDLTDAEAQDDYEESLAVMGRTPRRAHFATVPPSPAFMPDLYTYMSMVPPPPPPAPPAPPEPTAHELAEIKLRQRFDTMLDDLERDLGAAGGRNGRGSSRSASATDASTGDRWIYGWHPPNASNKYASSSSYAWQSWRPQPQSPRHDGRSAATVAAEAINAAAAPSTPGGAGGGCGVGGGAPGNACATASTTAPLVRSPLSDGPWLPRWQPQPSREDVEEAMDKLYTAEAHLHFRRVSSRSALRTWALSEDLRPARRMLRVGLRMWSQRAARAAWATWAGETAAWASRALKVHSQLAARRAAGLRSGWIAWRLERLRGMRARLEFSLDDHKTQGKRQLLRRWRDNLAASRDLHDSTLIKSMTFRRWLLLLQTRRLGARMMRESLAKLDDELAEGESPEPTAPHRRAHFATPTTYGGSATTRGVPQAVLRSGYSSGGAASALIGMHSARHRPRV